MEADEEGRHSEMMVNQHQAARTETSQHWRKFSASYTHTYAYENVHIHKYRHGYPPPRHDADPE